jgi:uncharacterized membrane protein
MQKLTVMQKSWPWWRWVMTGLSTLALALSAYLSWHYLMGGSVIGCGGGNSCDQVLSSRWSAIGGVLPVSGLAMGAYLALLVAIFFIGPTSAMPDRRLAWGAMLVLVGAAAGSAIWFTIVQMWVIRAFCPYCMAAHTTGLLLAALVIWRAPLQLEDVSTAVALPNPAPNATTGSAPQRVIGTLPAIVLPLIGLALAGILAAAQVIFTPKEVYLAGESQNNLPTIDTSAVPLVGSPDAPYIITEFFDYKCAHCQQVHAMLDEVIRLYNGKVAFVLRPAPLNSQCNPYVARDREEFKDSCELARISLVVWAAKREAFPAFDQWMFAPEPGALWLPRSVDAARAKAVALVGQEKFDAARNDPWINWYMQTSIEIYGKTVDQSGNSIPRMAYGIHWVTPEPQDAAELVLILQKGLALPKP